jgi:DNA-binding transcriptional ArsR family regulator
MSLLPSRGPEASTSQDGEIEIVGVDEDVSSVIDALSSETARDILNAVYEEPGTPSDLADRLDMSIQKVSYHLEKLEGEDLIAVAGTRYSEKGQEMNVYEPPEDPLVLFVGTQERKRSLRSLARRLLPVVGLLTAASALVQVLFGRVPDLFGAGGAGGAVGDQSAEEAQPPETATPEGSDISVAQTQERTAVEMAGEATEVATSGAPGGLDIEPGVAFFLGGLLVVTVLAATWFYTR